MREHHATAVQLVRGKLSAWHPHPGGQGAQPEPSRTPTPPCNLRRHSEYGVLDCSMLEKQHGAIKRNLSRPGAWTELASRAEGNKQGRPDLLAADSVQEDEACAAAKGVRGARSASPKLCTRLISATAGVFLPC